MSFAVKFFNRKDAEKCKVRKVQFHAVYSIVGMIIFYQIDLFHNPETPPVTGENFPVFCQKWEKPSCLMCILKVMEHV